MSFELLISAVPRRSNFVSRSELLDHMEQHSVSHLGPRNWCFCVGEDGLVIPTPSPVPRYLFRGQTKRHTPCFPSLYRHYRYPARYIHELDAEDAASIVANFARTMIFYSEVRHHPAFKWAKSARVAMEFAEIAQHHGIPTPLIDLSASIEVALFFATHDYDEIRGFTPRSEGRGVLYIVDRDGLPRSQQARFRSVAIQPFARPYRQWAWSCELLMGECFEACPCLAILEFEHDVAFAQIVRERAEAQGGLFPPDILADLADAIRSMRTLPLRAVAGACRHLGPAYPQHVFGPAEELLRGAGFSIWEKHEPILSDRCWEQSAPSLWASLNNWLRETARTREAIVMRRNTAGEPVALGRFNGPLVTPDSFEIIRHLAPVSSAGDSSDRSAP